MIQARYTVVLKTLMDNEKSMQELSTALSTYPLYEPETNILNIPERSELNQRLLNAYKYREIGFETVGRFLDELEITMKAIMPYYNEMFKTVEVMAGLDNPFDNVDVTETYSETTTGSATGTGTSSGTSTTGNTTTANDSSSTNSTVSNSTKNVHADTPADLLEITNKNIDSVNYADSAAWTKSDNTDAATTTGTSSSTSDSSSTQSAQSSNTTTSTGTVEHTFNKKGNQGVNTYAHDMIEFRQSIIDVADQIINDRRIAELFMNVY